MKLGFIGTGNMAGAIMGGIIKKGIIAPEEIIGSDIMEAGRERAKKEHGIHVTADNIEVTQKAEVLVLSVKPQFYAQTIAQSGSLYDLLSHFVYNNINMTKIESRPVKGKQWEYRFFVDFDGSLEDAAVKNALRGLREEATNLRILGNY